MVESALVTLDVSKGVIVVTVEKSDFSGNWRLVLVPPLAICRGSVCFGSAVVVVGLVVAIEK